MVNSPEAFGHATDALVRDPPRALGVLVDPDAHASPLEREHPGHGSLGLVALALEHDVFVADGRDPAVQTALARALAQLPSTYVVFHGAHEALLRLASALDTPASARAAMLGCTQTAAMLLAAGTRRGRDLPTLASCARKVLNLELPDSASLLDNPTQAVAARARAILPLMQALTPRLRRKDLTRIYQLECDVVAAIVAMERAGVAVDPAQYEQVTGSWSQERAHAQDPARRTRLDKLISTYGYWGQEYIRGGRIYCRLHPLATDSGRFSCSEPNLQQVPSEFTAPGLRACFKAPPGYALVIADYAQIELRVAAHLAPCEAMREVFRQRLDPHRATAATLTGKHARDVTDHERKLAKAVNFGFVFGMGATRFRQYAAQSYGVTLDAQQAAHARRAFFATFPGLASWHERVGKLGNLRTPVTVRTACGRRKRFASGKFSFNAALNIPVQGTAAEGFKLAMTALQPQLGELCGRGVLAIHDEYVAEVPRPHAERACALVRETMATSMASVVDTVPIEVEAKVADAWS